MSTRRRRPPASSGFEQSKELLLQTRKQELTEHLQQILDQYFSLSLNADRYNPEECDAVVVDYEFYEENSDFLDEINSSDNSFFNPLVLIARGEPRQVLPDYPVDTVHEIHDFSDQSSNLREDLEPLLAVRELTKELADFNNNPPKLKVPINDSSRKRFKRTIFNFQTKMHELDPKLFEHSRRTASYAAVLADEIGWEPKRRESLYISTLLHDIGKMAIPEPILYKPGSLTNDEFEIVQDHPSRGFECLPDTEGDLLTMVSNVTRYHHEKWDGTGYPDKLEGQDIPLSARIVALTDVFDALTHDRVYRDRMTEKDALDIIRDDRGTHFDPDLVDTFFNALPRLQAVK